MRAPDVMSCPEEASASKPAQEGFWFLWDVLSCLSSPGGLSCSVCLALEGYPVLSSVSSPRGLLIPPNFPREIFLGGRRVPAGVAWPRDEATVPMELLRLGTSLSGGGSYVRFLLCVSCVPASYFHIWFVSCPCFMSL